MRTLKIFDDGAEIATITPFSNGSVFIFARTAREWKEMRRLVDSGYKVNSKHAKFLNHVAERAQSYNYTTELVDE